MPDGRTLPFPTLGGKQLWGDVFGVAGHRIQRNMVTGTHRLLDARDFRLAWGTYAECIEVFEDHAASHGVEPISDHLVLLLHGMFRSKDAFRGMRHALRDAGYDPLAVNYPSTRRTVQAHAAQVAELLDNAADYYRRVSFVCHSLGGVVARVVLSSDDGWQDRLEVNRLVTIGTPNRGAAMVDLLGAFWAFRQVAGPASTDISTRRIVDVPLPSCPFGVVAGVRGDGAGYNPFIEGDDDMVVGVRSALLDEAEDQLVLPAVHTFIMNHPQVVSSTLRYLDTGRFVEGDSPRRAVSSDDED